MTSFYKTSANPCYPNCASLVVFCCCFLSFWLIPCSTFSFLSFWLIPCSTIYRNYVLLITKIIMLLINRINYYTSHKSLISLILSDTCSTGCYHGDCEDGTCICDTIFQGDDCKQRMCYLYQMILSLNKAIDPIFTPHLGLRITRSIHSIMFGC